MTEPLNWTAFQTLFVDYEGHSILSKEFLPTVVDIWSSDLNLPIPIHFNSLIPKVSLFTLAISCLTMSNLPWCMDLTSISLYFYHQTRLQLCIVSALAQPLPSFRSVSLLFPSNLILDTYWSGGLISGVISFCPFTPHRSWILPARILEVYYSLLHYSQHSHHIWRASYVFKCHPPTHTETPQCLQSRPESSALVSITSRQLPFHMHEGVAQFYEL